MKRAFTHLAIGIVTGIVAGNLSFDRGGEGIWEIAVILAIFGALIGGYWKNNIGALIGGLIMGFAPLIRVLVLFGLA